MLHSEYRKICIAGEAKAPFYEESGLSRAINLKAICSSSPRRGESVRANVLEARGLAQTRKLAPPPLTRRVLSSSDNRNLFSSCAAAADHPLVTLGNGSQEQHDRQKLNNFQINLFIYE